MPGSRGVSEARGVEKRSSISGSRQYIKDDRPRDWPIEGGIEPLKGVTFEISLAEEHWKLVESLL